MVPAHTARGKFKYIHVLKLSLIYLIRFASALRDELYSQHKNQVFPLFDDLNIAMLFFTTQGEL
ncbi:hypothetical protein A8L51_04330 [Pantoea stewartii]|nr:hypothetical protein [Pantoea stewartii]